MIGTVAVITAKPESAAEVETALRTLAEATQSEDGCQMYSLQRSLDAPNVFVTVEKWDSREALDAHMTSPHLTAALGLVGELLDGAPVIVPVESLNVGDTATHNF